MKAWCISGSFPYKSLINNSYVNGHNFWKVGLMTFSQWPKWPWCAWPVVLISGLDVSWIFSYFGNYPVLSELVDLATVRIREHCDVHTIAFHFLKAFPYFLIMYNGGQQMISSQKVSERSICGSNLSLTGSASVPSNLSTIAEIYCKPYSAL